jgi:hypothetical protein
MPKNKTEVKVNKNPTLKVELQWSAGAKALVVTGIFVILLGFGMFFFSEGFQLNAPSTGQAYFVDTTVCQVGTICLGDDGGDLLAGEVNQGEIFETVVVINVDEDLALVEFTFSYNPSIVSYVGYTGTEIIHSWGFENIVHNLTTHSITYTAMVLNPTSPIPADEIELVIFEFEVIGNEGQTIQLGVEDAQASDVDGNDLLQINKFQQELTIYTVPCNLDSLVGCSRTECNALSGADWDDVNHVCAVSVEICDDGSDNDGDGDIDCSDSDCVGDTVCEEDCEDGVDNDADGLVDCYDLDSCSDKDYCIEVILGDVNDDGSINNADAILIQRHIASIGAPLTADAQTQGNVNYCMSGQEELNNADAITIQRLIATIIGALPCS